jgi:hypothetical protein
MNVVRLSEIMVIDPARPALTLDIPKDQSFDDWVDTGRRLCASSQVINWYIGDWWAAGQHRYGARAKVAAEGLFGKEFQGLMDVASVCRAFPTSRRREALTFTHHREVAALPPEEADTLLVRAEDERLSTRELRKEVLRHRLARGDFLPRDDDDPEHTELLAIARAWNRARIGVRQEFAELVEEAGTGEIDP